MGDRPERCVVRAVGRRPLRVREGVSRAPKHCTTLEGERSGTRTVRRHASFRRKAFFLGLFGPATCSRLARRPFHKVVSAPSLSLSQSRFPAFPHYGRYGTLGAPYMSLKPTLITHELASTSSCFHFIICVH